MNTVHVRKLNQGKSCKTVDGEARTSDAWLMGVPTFDYGNNIRQMAKA